MKTLALALALALPVASHAQAHHSINFTQPLIGVDGKPVPGSTPGSKLTLGDAAVIALETPTDGDRTSSGEAKFKLDQLARKIYGKDAVVITVEETATIKDRIAKVYGPLVVGCAWRLLDPALE